MASRLDWRGDEVETLIYAAAAEGLGDALNVLADASQEKVPVQTSDLKNSKFVDQDGLRGVVGYTDSKAAAAHENLTARLRNGKQAKFLESASIEERAAMERAVAEPIRRVL